MPSLEPSNADVVRQVLASEKGIEVSLRTMERAVEPWRRELGNAALATVRFETPPGKQLQADFGQCLVRIGGERVRVYLAVLTLGYSRRLLVRAYRSEKQDHGLQKLEEGLRHWGGVPKEVLMDNARALVSQRDPEWDVLVFAQRLEAFGSWAGLEAHLVRWTREVANLREEAQALQPLDANPSFMAERELVRIVHSACCVEVESNC